MIDRYTIFESVDVLQEVFNVSTELDIKPNYNAAPTQQLPVVLNSDPSAAQFMYWGQTPSLSKNKPLSKKLFNLPGLEALDRPLYRKQLESHRCIIPCNGFYIWKQLSKKQKTPYYCYRNDQRLLAIAGVWEAFEDLDGQQISTFNMIVIPSEDSLQGYQDFIPALLSPGNAKVWLTESLSPEEIKNIIQNSRNRDLQLHAVSPRISDPNNNSKTLIEPSTPSDQYGNYTLFS